MDAHKSDYNQELGPIGPAECLQQPAVERTTMAARQLFRTGSRPVTAQQLADERNRGVFLDQEWRDN